jgi:hypothetical protein
LILDLDGEELLALRPGAVDELSARPATRSARIRFSVETLIGGPGPG